MEAYTALSNIKRITSALELVEKRKRLETNISKCIRAASLYKQKNDKESLSRALKLVESYHEALIANHTTICEMVGDISKLVQKTSTTLEKRLTILLRKQTAKYLEIINARAVEFIPAVYGAWTSSRYPRWDYCVDDIKRFTKKMNMDFVEASKDPFYIKVRAYNGPEIEIGINRNKVYCKSDLMTLWNPELKNKSKGGNVNRPHVKVKNVGDGKSALRKNKIKILGHKYDEGSESGIIYVNSDDVSNAISIIGGLGLLGR